MPNYPTSLLIIVSLLVSLGRVYGDEQIRSAQTELRKRHLFYGEISGEPSPALSAAIRHYQNKKGFLCTGRLDSETSASLGLVKIETAPAQTPFVVAESGDLRGPNGEGLPSYLVLHSSGHEGADSLDLAATDPKQIALSLTHKETAFVPGEQHVSSGRSHARSHPVRVQKETNPLVLAFNSMNRAVKLLVGDAQPKKKRPSSRRL